MPAKKRKAHGKPATKKAKPSPLDCEAAWGSLTDDVAAAVGWAKLGESLAELTAPRLWANKLTQQSVSSKLPFPVIQGIRLPLLAAVKGERPEKCEPISEASGAENESVCRPCFVVSTSIALQEAPGRGRGWFAQKTIAAGTMVLIERPLAGILDIEWRDKDWADCGSSDTAALGIELSRIFSPSVGTVLAPFHPQESNSSSSGFTGFSAAGDDEDSDDPEALEALEEAVEAAWSKVDGLSDAAAERLRAVVRLNSLGYYTNSEQLCHHSNFTALTGSGLFALASGFNHSCEPSVARFSIGDITAFVTNRAIAAGDELCISYIESELLCAPTSLRRQSLNRDFTCACQKCVREPPEKEESGQGERCFMRVDSQVQANLSLLPSEERVEAVRQALQGNMGDDSAEEEEEENAEKAKSVTVLLGKDAQELRVVEATALMQLKRYAEALKVWRRSAAFSCHHCAPFDEALAVYGTQAALCALASSDALAHEYVSLAADAHQVAFGADIFRLRYAKEVEDSLVPEDTKAEFLRLVEGRKAKPQSFEEVVAAWKFASEEVPNAQDQF
eukprot:TRINITY_DN81146_c0_g1_i1.p1 TRINITY_DN81146_c0_g1~~TRINITY_DN81146_c0_g1_i1.p1  ORF type:complete len:562 (+),score=128.18 TRINITY_DN81146_c0_g1_i1:50-1735(+)